MLRPLLAAIILIGAAPANAAPLKADLKKKIAEALDKGEEYSFQNEIADALGVPQHSPAKVLEVAGERAQDGFSHDFLVFYNADNKATAVVVAVAEETQSAGAYRYYKGDLDGVLKKAFVQTGKNDDAASETKDLFLDAPETKTQFARELDFWLKGKYRKPAAPAKPAEKQNAPK